MMILLRQDGSRVTLGQRLGSGGEAQVFSLVAEPNLVAKVYHHASAERTAKLHVMISNPPLDPTAQQGHVSICWPIDTLRDPGGACIGFLMHRVNFTTSVPVFRLYNPQDRQQVAPSFTWEYLVRIAVNICSAIEAIHGKGYVIGDLNESNILAANTALVALVDCDSMQVPEPGTGRFFRCTVGKPDFTPPELQGVSFSAVDRDTGHDNFGLAVIIFMLLMEGVHPFTGVWRLRGDPPGLEDRIRNGECPYFGSNNVTPMPAAPPLYVMPQSLVALFERCFRDGHRNPGVRPTPQEWRLALAVVEQGLMTCHVNSRHVYSGHLGDCPWCERSLALGGIDPFPAVVQQKPLQAAAFATHHHQSPHPAQSRPIQATPPAVPAQTPVQPQVLPARPPSRKHIGWLAALFACAGGIAIWFAARPSGQSASISPSQLQSSAIEQLGSNYWYIKIHNPEWFDTAVVVPADRRAVVHGAVQGDPRFSFVATCGANSINSAPSREQHQEVILVGSQCSGPIRVKWRATPPGGELQIQLTIPSEVVLGNAQPTPQSQPQPEVIAPSPQAPPPPSMVPGEANAGMRILLHGYVDGRNRSGIALLDSGGISNVSSVSFLPGNGQISHDGRLIAFDNCTNPARGIYVARLDGSEMRMVASLGGDYCTSVRWSPDDRQISYSNPSDNFLYATRVDGPSSIRLSNAGMSVFHSWSPRGDQIVYESGRGGSRLLYSVNMAGDVKQVTPSQDFGNCEAWAPDWSRDGKRIAFTSCNGTLITISPEGKDQQQVTANAYYPRWSLDGQWLFFLSGLDGAKTTLMRVRSDGESLSRVGSILPYGGRPFSLGATR